MLISKALPFINEFINDLDKILSEANTEFKLSRIQKEWFVFCLQGIILTNTLCWSRFKKWSVGERSVASLSAMFRNSDIKWDQLLFAAVKSLLSKYSLDNGILVIDDSDHERSKNTSKIFGVHKIKDKKTGGNISGQCLVFLVLVTDKITLPVGFRFHIPDPEITEWKKQDDYLKSLGRKKEDRPEKPLKKKEFPTKIEIALELIKEFKNNFSNIHINTILADAAYGSIDFVNHASEIYQQSQIVSQIKSNQHVMRCGSWLSVTDYFKNLNSIKTKVHIRGGKQIDVCYVSARIVVKSHEKKRLIVAIKYEDEEDYRFLIAPDLCWRTIDVIQSYSYRWLVEVFFEDWKVYEGWGQLALQQGVEGSFHGVILSLLVDLCLLTHPAQSFNIKNKNPLYSVGSLRDTVRAESLVECINALLEAEEPNSKLNEFKNNLSEMFEMRKSEKHMIGRPFQDYQGTPALIKKYGA